MPKKHLMYVDASVRERRAASDMLASDKDFTLATTAATISIAAAKLTQVNPDAVIVNATGMEAEAAAFFVNLKSRFSGMPVVMLYADGNKNENLKELVDVAFAYDSSGVGRILSTDALPWLRSCQAATSTIENKDVELARPVASPASQRPNLPLHPVSIVAIGISTGGPNALGQFLPLLPRNLPVPIVMVQHMPSGFTHKLAENLTLRSGHQVHEACEGDILRPGEIWLAPGDYHMEVRRKGVSLQLCLNQNPPENSCRPAVDPLLRSVARIYGPGALAVIMTGMGNDGVRGCEAIREAGGQVLVQDEESSVVWGMPGAVVAAGLADDILPLSKLASEIHARIRRTGRTGDGK